MHHFNLFLLLFRLTSSARDPDRDFSLCHVSGDKLAERISRRMITRKRKAAVIHLCNHYTSLHASHIYSTYSSSLGSIHRCDLFQGAIISFSWDFGWWSKRDGSIRSPDLGVSSVKDGAIAVTSRKKFAWVCCVKDRGCGGFKLVMHGPCSRSRRWCHRDTDIIDLMHASG
jgi:hypothetical protein